MTAKFKLALSDKLCKCIPCCWAWLKDKNRRKRAPSAVFSTLHSVWLSQLYKTGACSTKAPSSLYQSNKVRPTQERQLYSFEAEPANGLACRPKTEMAFCANCSTWKKIGPPCQFPDKTAPFAIQKVILVY